MCITYLCVQARCMQREEMSLVYPPEEKLVSGVSVVLPELLFNINDKDKLADKDKKLAGKNSCMHQKVLDALQKFESARHSEREADRKAEIACKLARLKKEEKKRKASLTRKSSTRKILQFQTATSKAERQEWNRSKYVDAYIEAVEKEEMRNMLQEAKEEAVKEANQKSNGKKAEIGRKFCNTAALALLQNIQSNWRDIIKKRRVAAQAADALRCHALRYVHTHSWKIIEDREH